MTRPSWASAPVVVAIDPTVWLSGMVTAEGGKWLPLPDSFSSYTHTWSITVLVAVFPGG